MSVRIYKLGGSATTSGIQGVHAIIHLYSGQYASLNVHSSATTTATTTANQVVSAPFIPNEALDVSDFVIFCTTASVGGLARVMVYSNAVGGGIPDKLIYSSADINIASTGVKSTGDGIVFDALTTYWVAIQTNSSTAVFTAIPVGNMLTISTKSNDGSQLGLYTAVGTFASGAETSFANYTSQSYNAGAMPTIAMKIR